MRFDNLFERIAFHLPFSHGWLAERDCLRNDKAAIQSDLVRSQLALEAASRQLDAASRELDATSRELADTKRTLDRFSDHFYSPIPSLVEVEADRDRIFKRPHSLPAVDLNENRQLELFDRFRQWYTSPRFPATQSEGRRYYHENTNFGHADAMILYCMMRLAQPRRVVEVGSGYSSCAILDINDQLFEGRVACTFIEPYPNLLYSLIRETDCRNTRIFGHRVQDVDLDVFKELEAGDILFIDSSHVSKTGSDVNFLLFDVLPFVQDGVYIHFHDIFYPFEYPEQWVFEGRAWNEVYLMRAFLAHNPAFRIEFFSSYIVREHQRKCESEFTLFANSCPGSIWLRKLQPAE
jgi:predicted O-methyltransferase YrrM